jgi:hypothetical protein
MPDLRAPPIAIEAIASIFIVWAIFGSVEGFGGDSQNVRIWTPRRNDRSDEGELQRTLGRV